MFAMGMILIKNMHDQYAVRRKFFTILTNSTMTTAWIKELVFVSQSLFKPQKVCINEN